MISLTAICEKKNTTKAIPESELILQITTGKKKNAGTNALKIYVQINNDEGPKFYLNKPNHNDFEEGATDTYDGMKFKLPLDKLKKFIIGAESGNDAWLMRKFAFQIKQGNKISDLVEYKTNTWISVERGDRGKTKKNFYLRKKVVLKEIKPKK